MEFLEKGLCLEEALGGFDFGGRVAGALRYGQGHINHTFAVYTQQQDDSAKRFILQKINTQAFRKPDELMENIIGVTTHLRKAIEKEGGDPARETLTVLYAKDGSPCFRSSDGGWWRCYTFIEGAISYQKADTPELFAASAAAFGGFMRRMEDYPAKSLHETIPKFHDTRQRFKNLVAAIEADSHGRKKDCLKEIEFALAREKDAPVLMDLLEAGELPLRVTHNDTKLNNVLIDPETGKGVCVIDLDTVMPGLFANDFGDAIRFGASTAAEDETNLELVQFSLPLYKVYTESTIAAAGSALTAKEKEMLPWGAKLMTYECGMRFLTDYLEGDVYFHTAREQHNLERCRTQFKLVAEMEAKWNEMTAVI